jgi:hypothetical protein
MAFKVRSLYVRPWRSADLGFEVGGILSSQNQSLAELGAKVTQFNLADLLASAKTLPASKSGRPQADAQWIGSQLASKTLFMLRSGFQETALEQVVLQREIAWLERYQHKTEIVAAIKNIYISSGGNEGKVDRLDRLSKELGQYRSALKTAYEAQPGWNLKVEKNVVRELTTDSINSGTTDALTKLSPVAMQTSSTNIVVTGTAPSNHAVGGPQVVPQKWAGASWVEMKDGELGFKSQITSTDHKLTQSSVTKNHDFRHPYLESSIAENRAQLEYQDEYLIHQAIAVTASEYDSIMDRELHMIDAEISKAQYSFVQTFLASPISGVVTAIYKDVGEWVQPGEPVIRVEDDSRILLIGVLQYRGLLRVGKKIRVKASNIYDEINSSKNFEAKIVSIRGHDSDDAEWDVILACDNGPDLSLPLNYHFDKDTTTFELV